MPKSFEVKLPQKLTARMLEYVVATCPKCGKKTYGTARQKGKKCPVCRHQYPMPGGEVLPRFKTPEEACRYILAEEAKRAGRMDFVPVACGFRPVAFVPLVGRTSKAVTTAKSLDAQFATWVRQYFLTAVGNCRMGIPTTVVIAASKKAGFNGVDKLIEKAVTSGFLIRPKPYSIWIAE